MGAVNFTKRNCCAILVQTFFICAFIGGYIAFLVTFLDQDRDVEKSAVFPQSDPSSAETVTLIASIVSTSPADYTVRVTIDVAQVPQSWFDDKGQLNKTFTIGLGNQEFKVQTRNFPAPAVNLPLTKGSFDLYPFDNYDSEISVYVYTGPTFETSDLDLILQVRKAIYYGFSVDVGEKPVNQEVGFVDFSIKIDRTGVFKVYPIFQIISFLLIALVMGAFASVAVIWNHKKIEPPVFGSAIALIFALPAFRNTAPASPPIGCTLDVCSFYWAMLVAILVFIGFAIRYLMQAPAPPAGGDIQHNMIAGVGKLSRKARGIDDDDDDGVPMQEVK